MPHACVTLLFDYDTVYNRSFFELIVCQLVSKLAN
ncbi:hypothetical protein C8P68_101761 [Mucilaginibacter yixingensis]|uniref:Uncharacterized protein n=1 Tax=Mucilaginibacter yixingensis TaxID=1295612 RepID=A0A2T5JGG8_9SPHI|nr:hypothetical protein C8P68_101761 [Mucilaginibacter yixingensis]